MKSMNLIAATGDVSWPLMGQVAVVTGREGVGWNPDCGGFVTMRTSVARPDAVKQPN
jgi:hypothetical protein